jgi:glutaredoxin
VSAGGPGVVLYTRAGCHLCEDAEAVLRAALERAPFELTVVDVDADPALTDRYGLRVPVVAVDGVDRFEFEVPEAELLALLGADAAAPGTTAGGRTIKRRFWRW